MTTSYNNTNCQARQETRLVTFNDFDIYLLAYHYLVDLRAEIRQAEMKARITEFYEGTPYADESPFPWADYAATCREALRCRTATAKAIPPKLPGKRIDVEAVKARNDIASVIEQYTALKKSGHDRFTGRCPLHEDKHPSLTVYADSQSWWCFSCNEGGDIFNFIMAVNSCDFRQAAAVLGGW